MIVIVIVLNIIAAYLYWELDRLKKDIHEQNQSILMIMDKLYKEEAYIIKGEDEFEYEIRLKKDSKE